MKPFDQYTPEEQQAVLGLLRSQKGAVFQAAAFMLDGSASLHIETDVSQSSCMESSVVIVQKQAHKDEKPYQHDREPHYCYGLPIGEFGLGDEAGQRFLVTATPLPRNPNNFPKENPWRAEQNKRYCQMFRAGEWGTNRYNGDQEFCIGMPDVGVCRWGRVTPKVSTRTAVLLDIKPVYVVDVYDPNWPIDAFNQNKYGRKPRLLLRKEVGSLKEAARVIFETRYPEAVPFLKKVRAKVAKPKAA